VGLEAKCVQCHKDVHQKTLSADCASCHDVNSFKPASLFNHDQTNFELNGSHKKLIAMNATKRPFEMARNLRSLPGYLPRIVRVATKMFTRINLAKTARPAIMKIPSSRLIQAEISIIVSPVIPWRESTARFLVKNVIPIMKIPFKNSRKLKTSVASLATKIFTRVN